MTDQRLSRKIKFLGLPLGVAGFAAAALLASGTFSASAVAGSSPDKAAAEAEQALTKGKTDKALKLVEALVAANPRESAYRALLGRVYLKSGRFDSAITAFNNAMTLGENSARTALSLALAQTAAGKPREAVAILDDWRDAIPAADLGLALALAGEQQRGIAILADALRAGNNTPKLRQNLAYAYALDGRWREARVMAAQDVPANELDARLSSWAATSKEEDSMLRIATLLRAPLRSDPGQPAVLALNDISPREQLAVETPKAKPVAITELPPAASEAGVTAPEPEAASAPPAALAQYTPVIPEAVSAPAAEFAQKFRSAFAAQPAHQAPATPAITKSVHIAVNHEPARQVYLRPHNVPYSVNGTHMVQLGSFSSEQGARRAWGIYSARNRELRSYRMIITPAVVHGKNFWRVAAGGFDAGSASSLCSKVKGRGGVCFAFAAGRVLPTGKTAIRPALAMSRAVHKPFVQTGQNRGPAGLANARRR